MSVSRTQRLVVIWIAAGQMVWALCLLVLWGGAGDSSGRATVLTAGALLASVALCCPLPSRAARAFQRMLAWMRLQDLAAGPLAASGQRWAGGQDIRTMMRLLALTAGLSSVGGLLATGGVWAGQRVLDAMAGWLVWDWASWSAATFLVEVVLLTPLGAAIALAFQASALLRRSGGQDAYATVCYDYGYAAALASAALAGIWLTGMNLLGVCLVLAVLVPACVLPLLGARPGVIPPRRIDQVVERPAPAQGYLVAGEFAGLALVLLVQLRLVGDALAWSTPARAAWLAITFLACAGLMAWTDKRAGPAGRAQSSGATIAVLSAALTQAALLAGAVVWQARSQAVPAWAVLALAGAGQGLLAGAAGHLVARRRRAFASQGGRAGGYLAGACAGGAGGVVAYVVLAGLAAGPVVLLAAAMAGLAGAVVWGLGWFPRVGEQLRWALNGVVLICALTGAMLVPMRQGLPISRGAWLSLQVTGEGAPSGLVRPGRMGPNAAGDLLGQLLSGPGGRGFWLVCADEWPGELGSQATFTASALDPQLVPPGPWRKGLHGLASDFLPGLRCGQGRYDGILISALPADHAQAWRCYGRQTLERCRQRLHEGGLLILRTRVSADRVGDAVAVLASLRDAMGPGWVAAGMRDGVIDLLAVAGGSARAPGGVGEIRVGDLDRILGGLDVRAMGADYRPALLGGGQMSATEFLERFK